ncbi:MAG: PDZ domain-containing protein [Terriglobia bacterium]
MKIRDHGSGQIEDYRGHTMSRKFISGLTLACVLLVAGGGTLHGQKVPNPPPAPEAAPEPPDPPEAPDPPEVFLLNDGAVHLGVTLSDVTTEKAQELKLPAVAGAIVETVQKDSAAAKAGLEVGDAIIEFDGVRVRSSAELRRLIRETPAGRAVEMKIVRDGKTRVLSAKLEATSNYSFNIPEVHIPPINVPPIHIPPLDFNWGHRATLGISADDLTPQLAQYFGVTGGKGVLIAEVTKGGAADKAGLKAGDVIVWVNGNPVCSVEEIRNALNENITSDTRKVTLTIVRDRREQTVNADLTRPQGGEKHSTSAAQQSYDQALAQMQKAQADQQRAQANQMRALADGQRALVQAEVLKQQEQVQAEWRRQLQEQMKSLKDQLKHMQNLRVAQHQDDEI